jgi:methylmalonyl-CoA/ethylmalonyl-CoA epimerase
MLTRIDHVGIACRDLDASIGFYTATFGLTVTAREVNNEQGVEEAMLEVAVGSASTAGTAGPAGSYVQLIMPTRDDSPVGRFLARNGEGLHHVGYGVADVRAALETVAGRGVRLVDERPRHGSMGAAIAFLHPKDVGGVLTELVQAAR